MKRQKGKRKKDGEKKSQNWFQLELSKNKKFITCVITTGISRLLKSYTATT